MLSVDNNPLSAETIETEFKRLRRVYEKQMSAAELKNHEQLIRQQAKDHAINRQLLLAEANRRIIEIPDREIDEILSQAGKQNAEERESVRNACRVEKLIASIIASVPKPTNEEVTKYLKEYAAVDTDNKQNPELLRQFIDKTRVLLHRLRQNQALNEFIAGLRKQADIKETTFFPGHSREKM